MKKIFALLIAVITMTTKFNLIASALDYENFVYEFTDNKIIITNYTGATEGTITVPNEIDGKEVSEIGEKAFYGLLNQDSTIVISDNISIINDYSFTGLIGIGMDAIYIPESMEYIGKYSIGYTYYPYSNTQNECIVEQYKAYPIKIYGYIGTAAETYANENGFTFIALDEPISTTTTQVNPITTSTSTTVSTTTVSSDDLILSNTSTTVSTVTVTSDIQTTTTQTSPSTSTVDEVDTTSKQTTTITQKVNSDSNGNANNSKGNSSSSPKTGDSFPIVSILTAIGISAVSTVLFMKKRK